MISVIYLFWQLNEISDWPKFTIERSSIFYAIGNFSAYFKFAKQIFLIH